MQFIFIWYNSVSPEEIHTFLSVMYTLKQEAAHMGEMHTLELPAEAHVLLIEVVKSMARDKCHARVRK
jgi:hypothetical protein